MGGKSAPKECKRCHLGQQGGPCCHELPWAAAKLKQSCTTTVSPKTTPSTPEQSAASLKTQEPANPCLTSNQLRWKKSCNPCMIGCRILNSGLLIAMSGPRMLMRHFTTFVRHFETNRLIGYCTLINFLHSLLFISIYILQFEKKEHTSHSNNLKDIVEDKKRQQNHLPHESKTPIILK